MIVMKILLEAALDTLALISFPDFDFHMGRNQSCVWKLNDPAKCLLFDGLEEKLEDFSLFSSQRKVCIEQLKKSLVAPYSNSNFFIAFHQLSFSSQTALKIHGRLENRPFSVQVPFGVVIG